MKIQHLAIIFLIIILPISLILSEYLGNQIETLNLQIIYDSKLQTATNDAIRAYKLNTINSTDIATSRIRDLEASVNTFFDSISMSFPVAEYDNEEVRTYVPALVYTMYDGYYIYSLYTNDIAEEDVMLDENSTYEDGTKIYGIKPYIYYSCRYKNASGTIDIVITYTLDNYITIQGVLGTLGNINKSGYLIETDGTNGIELEGNSTVKYKGIEIEENEELSEYLGNINTTNQYKYIKRNGTKYYWDPEANKSFSFLNETRLDTSPYTEEDFRDNSAKEYYIKAYEFTKWVRENLSDITPAMAVDADGNPITDFVNYDIFKKDSSTNIEDEDSDFNQHRKAVIRYSIERNLSIAIANYNNYTGSTTDFRMPKLKEDEWEKIMNNMSLISFLQGFSIGGKMYNGYSIVVNNENKENVAEDSIYITTSDKNYHTVTDKNLINLPSGTTLGKGYSNTDFEIRSRRDYNNEEDMVYYVPREEMGCYDCIIGQTTTADIENKNTMEYIDSCGNNELRQKYYTALGRERYGMYRSNYYTYTTTNSVTWNNDGTYLVETD